MSNDNALKWMPQDINDKIATLVLAMVWCCHATSHYLNQCCHWITNPYYTTRPQRFNSLRPRQNGRHFPDDIFKLVFLNENVWIFIKISLKFVSNVLTNNIPPLVQIMAWRWPGDKSLSEPMMVSLLTHICVTRPQWVNIYYVTLT